MDYYNSTISKNPRVEAILISQDDDLAAGLNWAKKEKFPFPIVLPSNQNNFKLSKYAPRSVPHYVLLDKDGKQLAIGLKQCMNRVRSIR